ncbi:Lambda A [Mahlapitsi orthoreovirus]|uniref:Lambda A n=1 Tax=Mahlapitsi orthoreovirus TaxID=2170064 RepID=A0A3G1DHK3_9REOV|nr:Lambda A [Mahlapitsi orthoreovirus]AMU04171.1 Lambda A [Mahlapitsi orthoreovirus]
MDGYRKRIVGKKRSAIKEIHEIKKLSDKDINAHNVLAGSTSASKHEVANPNTGLTNPPYPNKNTDSADVAKVINVASDNAAQLKAYVEDKRDRAVADNNPNRDSSDEDAKRADRDSKSVGGGGTATYVPEGNLGLNELKRSSTVDHDGGVKVESIRKEAKDSVATLLDTRPIVSGLPVVSRPRDYVCLVCMRAFMSAEQLEVHQLTHSIGPIAGLTSYETDQAVNAFVESWSAATAAANLKSALTLDELDNLMMIEAPQLITWDSGICSSFQLVPIIPARTVQDVIKYTWFSSSYNIDTPFPQGNVVRIMVNTNWGAKLDHDRNCHVQVHPPTMTNVSVFREMLNMGLTPDGSFNPRVLRANVILMCVKFVLDNLHINRNTAYVLDVTAALDINLGAKQLRSISDDDGAKWFPIMYPSRVKLPLRSKTAEFVNYCVEGRIGRYDRAQTFSGVMAEWADNFETCDSLTLSIRERWLQRLMGMNITPGQVAEALSRCSKHFLTISSSQAPSITRLMPIRATTAERQLLQLMQFMNIGTNANYIQPIISNAARVLSKISPLLINPRLISDAISSVVEQTNNTVSPAATILMRLRPTLSDFSDFRRACVAMLYNGAVVTYLDEQSYPKHKGNVLDVETLIDIFVCLNAMPLMTDPNGPCKAFMVVANAMYGFENIAMNDPNWNQQIAAASFNSPHLWPQCFVQRTIDRQRCPILHKWADTIHNLWPRPSRVTYGAPDILGSANLFTPPDVLLLPFQTLAANTVSPTLNLVNEYCNWRNAIVDLITGIVNDGRFTVSWNPAMRASMTNAMMKFRIMKSYTPAYIAELLPLELAAIAPTLPLQPLQVPYVGLARERIVTQVNVSRQAPNVIHQPALNISVTQQMVGVPLAINARPITVALLSGTYPEEEPLITNVWYANTLTPLYTHDGLFANQQHAVVVSEAYRTTIACMAQCANMQYPIEHPFEWITQIELGANESANLARRINKAFLEAFGMHESTILLQPFLEGDPRATQLTISYQRADGTTEQVTPDVSHSCITDSVIEVGNVLSHEYNLFGLCRGDIIIGQYLTEAGFNPLSPPAALVFDEGDEDVHVFSNRTIATFGMNGSEMTVEDENGDKIPLRGKWVMPLSLWQINNAFFTTILPSRIRAGQLFIRVKLGAYPYMLSYFNARDQFDGFDVFQKWMSTLSATGMGPVPMLMPESQDHNVSSGLIIHYIWATEYNDRSLFCTNSSSPITVFGPDKSVPLERYTVLVDEDAPPRTTQLPQMVDFYNLIRRYNFETPSITAVVTTYGDGLPANI